MTTVFERHKITTLSTLVGLGLIFCLIILNALGSSLGLGKVVIYQSHPIYGYRPIPNQTVSRTGAMIKINNLSYCKKNHKTDFKMKVIKPQN